MLRHNLPEKSVIRRVALCGGAGEFLIPRAVTAGADAFLTGEIGYHRFFGYEKELLIAALGHYQSERYTIDLLEQILRKAHPELRLVQSAVKTDPIAVTTTSLYDSIKAGE